MGVIDYTTNEIYDPMVGGIHDGGPQRLRRVGALGLPQVVVPGCIDFAVFHAGHIPEVLADPDVYPYLSDPVLPSGETRDRAFAQLGKFVHRARAKKLSVDVVLEDGDIVDQIVEKATRLPADLIVLGTHGRSGLARRRAHPGRSGPRRVPVRRGDGPAGEPGRQEGHAAAERQERGCERAG